MAKKVDVKSFIQVNESKFHKYLSVGSKKTLAEGSNIGTNTYIFFNSKTLEAITDELLEYAWVENFQYLVMKSKDDPKHWRILRVGDLVKGEVYLLDATYFERNSCVTKVDGKEVLVWGLIVREYPKDFAHVPTYCFEREDDLKSLKTAVKTGLGLRVKDMYEIPESEITYAKEVLDIVRDKVAKEKGLVEKAIASREEHAKVITLIDEAFADESEGE